MSIKRKRHVRRLAIWGMAAAVLVFGPRPAAGQSATIQLRPSTTYQVMTGWEATAQAGQEEASNFSSYKNALYDAAVELGINRLRLEIRGGAENSKDHWSDWQAGRISETTWKGYRYQIVNDNSDPRSINWSGFQFSQLDYVIDQVVVPMRQRLAAKGETLFINLCYVDFGGASTTVHANPEEYAEVVQATYQHMQSKYGFVPDTWEMALEPDNTQFWRGNLIGQAIVASAARLKALGFTPRFVAPSTTAMSNAPGYFDDLRSVSGALAYLSELSYHRYGGVSDYNLQQIANRAVQYNVKTGMLEHIGADYQALHRDLTLGRNSSWQQFTLGFPTSDDGAQYFTIDSSSRVAIGSRTRLLRQYFKWVRMGATRIDATSSDTAVEPVAFINRDGSYVAVLKASSARTMAVQGLPAGTYGITYTTTSQYNVSAADVTIASGQSVTASIPAGGVLTIYRKAGGSTSRPPGAPANVRIIG